MQDKERLTGKRKTMVLNVATFKFGNFERRKPAKLDTSVEFQKVRMLLVSGEPSFEISQLPEKLSDGTSYSPNTVALSLRIGEIKLESD